MTTLRGLLSRFLAWWFAELASCLPAGLRSLLQRRGPILAIALVGDEARLRLGKGEGWRELGRILLRPAGAAELRRAFAGALHGVPLRGAEIVVELPADRVLRRMVDLPTAAAENLREVLSFEMDRHTPFRAEEVAFDFRVAGTDPATKRMTVDLAVVPAPLVEQATAVTEAFGVRPDRISVAGGPAAAPVNFLAPAVRHQGGVLGRRLSLALGIAAAALVVAAVYLPLHQERQLLASYEAQLAQSRAAAADADALRKRVTAALERTRFLVERRLSTPTTAALFKEVTERLPDDSWLTQLRLHGNQVTLSGFSPAAASLIAGLEASPLLAEVRFASPVIADPRVALERFNLSAVLTPAPGS
jgi:general secretion pathway protein L